MDLTQYTSKKTTKKEVIRDDEHITHYIENDKHHITPKTKQGLQEYENTLFLSPTTAITTDSIEYAQQFFTKAIDQGAEGVMIKSLASPYISGLRTGAMAKFKETLDDIDLVIVAAEHGQGKRAGYFSSFYVAVANEHALDENDQYLTIGKVSSGIKELEGVGATLENLTNLLLPHKINEKKSITYFEPNIVLQIKYQEIQPSTTYSSNYALRFPRIIMLREDKPLNEITTIDDIKKIVNS